MREPVPPSDSALRGVTRGAARGYQRYRSGTYEDYVGQRGLKGFGEKRWRKLVGEVVALLVAAPEPEDVVIGGGNVNLLATLPPGCRVGDNANAFLGGFRLWSGVGRRRRASVGCQRHHGGKRP